MGDHSKHCRMGSCLKHGTLVPCDTVMVTPAGTLQARSEIFALCHVNGVTLRVSHTV